eukprot:895268-Heterocapsa_arctica.AAC.1
MQAVKAEAATAAGRVTASFLWDLSDYFEYINRTLLRTRASAARFPIVVTDLSLSMYCSQRFLTINGQFTCMGTPGTGVPAGCAFATAHIQVYSAAPIEQFQIQHPDLDLSIYIDDFVGS